MIRIRQAKPIPRVSNDPAVQARYVRFLRLSRGNHEYALEMSKGPGFAVPAPVGTDSIFFAGTGTLLDQFGGDEEEVGRVVKAAKANGYTPNPNDFYAMSLANKPGDPQAFISHSGGRGHIRRVCEERGVSCTGAVNYTAPPQPPRPKKKLADRLVRRIERNMIKANPDLAHKDRAELRSQIIENHGFSN